MTPRRDADPALAEAAMGRIVTAVREVDRAEERLAAAREHRNREVHDAIAAKLFFATDVARVVERTQQAVAAWIASHRARLGDEAR